MSRVTTVAIGLVGLMSCEAPGASDRAVSEAWAVYQACHAKATETRALMDEAIEVMSATVTREMEAFQRTARTMQIRGVSPTLINRVRESLLEIGDARILLLEAQAANIKHGRVPEVMALSLLEQEIVAVTDSLWTSCPEVRR